VEHFDVVVLGGGPGGYAAALYGAAAGLSVGLVEEDRVGGTCLHRGCIPAKELLQTAEVLRTVRTAGEYGVNVGEPTLDLKVALARKQQVVDRLTSGTETLLKGRKVTTFNGRGIVLAANRHRVAVSDGTEIEGDALVLATGSYPRSLPGLNFDGTRILSSDHVLELTDVPERVLIVGGGAIGCEFASYLVDVGSQVTLVEALPRLLPGVDRACSDVVTRAFKKRGIDVHTGATLASIEGTRELTVEFAVGDGEHRVTVDQTVISIGRSPRTSGVGLEHSGVVLDEAGYVQVDDHMRTAIDGVYAVGDIVRTPALAHVAFAEAILVVKDILGEPALPIDYDRVPWGIYCHPEVAYAGLTEEQARDRGYDVITSSHRFAGDGRAMIIGETDGLVKIVAERDGPILGVHIAGPWATELIAEGYLAVNWEATPQDVATYVHPHPTLSEMFGETALAMTGRALH
jgi:dihydrolipoamide dehydrogenase